MGLFFILAGAAIRVLSHFHFIPALANFAPIAAMALFGGVYFSNKKWAIIIPLVAMFISDIFIGFYSIGILLSVYGSFLIIGAMGLWLRNNKSVTNIIGATMVGSVLFFLITNFAVWAVPQSYYPHTLQGLLDSYMMGLPFFRNTLMGDMFYVGTMFALMELTIYVKNKIVIYKNIKITK